MHPATGGWGNGEGQADYTVYFYAQVDKPMENYGFWSADIPDDWVRKARRGGQRPYLQRVAAAPVVTGIDRIEGKHIGFYTEFGTRQDEQVVLRAGISFVDMEGARKNFEAEIAGKAFDQVAREARELWNRELARIRVDGAATGKRRSSTALYHTMIDPRIYTDADGRYPGADGRIHTTGGRFTKRTIFSGWDVFRSQMPLQTIINPQLVSDLVNSLVTMADEKAGAAISSAGRSSTPTRAACWVTRRCRYWPTPMPRASRSYDVEKAYRYAVNSSKRFGNDPLGYPLGTVHFAHARIRLYRLVHLAPGHAAGQAGKTPSSTPPKGRPTAISSTGRRAGSARAAPTERGSRGPRTPAPPSGTAASSRTPISRGWFVPHDVEGMVSLMGGREAVLRDLTEFFDKTPSDMLWNDYYNHANEPVHLVPFLFNRLGQPWQTQKWTRHICEKGLRRQGRGDRGQRGRRTDVGLVRACGRGPASRLPGRHADGDHQPRLRPHRTAPRPGLRTGRDIHRRGAREQPLERLHTAGGAQRQGAHSIAPRLRRHCGRRDARTLHGRHPQHPVGHIGNNRTNLIISLITDDKPMENTVNKDRSRLRSSLQAIAAAGLFGLCSLPAAFAQKQAYVQYVNTLQGTDSKFELSYGNTYATTGMPYGMHT